MVSGKDCYGAVWVGMILLLDDPPQALPALLL